MATTRVTQSCDLCHQDDTDPRHSILTALGEARTAHFDCCSAAGCPVCAEALASAPKGKRHGSALVDHLTGK